MIRTFLRGYLGHILLCLVAGWMIPSPVTVGPALAAEVPTMSITRLREARKQLAHRPRRVIFNNDGCDCLYYPRGEKATVEGFLAKRTTALAGTQVDTISYCTISSGFSYFTHDTKVGTVLARSASEFGIAPEMRNIAKELIDLGTDCLQAEVEFARRQKMEIFWSMRMNDTHDVEHSPQKPYLLFPPLKYEHPEWLVGDPVHRTPVGRWSSVDYARPEIRDLAFRYIEEVCRRYDVDGVELDFFRHLCYFKSVVQGGVASEDERDMMTDLVRRVREMTEQVGCRRGKPILVMIRVPDSIEYSRDMGLDVERWLREGLVDLLVTTCYFQLNPWEYSVALGHKYGVPVYAGLSEARVKGEDRFRRGQIECYRGRAANAWAAGVDGIYVFNYFNPRGAVFRELGDPRSLGTMDKLYFVTVRDGGPDRFLAKGSQYQSIPILTPDHPTSLGPSRPLSVPLSVAEDLSQTRAGPPPEVRLHLEIPGLASAEQVSVQLGGQTLPGGRLHEGWIDYPVPLSAIRPEKRQLRLTIVPSPSSPADAWNIAYHGRGLPAKPWRRDPGSTQTEEKPLDGGLLIADRGRQPGDYLYYRYAWGLEPGEPIVAEARVKVISGSSYLILCNGEAQERLGLWPDHIDLWSRRKLRYDMNTTDDFHVYRIETNGRDLAVYVDGQLRLDAKGLFAPSAAKARSEIAFGAANSDMVGEAVWASVRTRSNHHLCHDAVLSVEYPKK